MPGAGAAPREVSVERRHSAVVTVRAAGVGALPDGARLACDPSRAGGRDGAEGDACNETRLASVAYLRGKETAQLVVGF